MRLKGLTIKRFRSILDIDNFEIIDPRITTFIGENGSGKSNILKAIASLKEDEGVPSDDDFYADEFERPEEEIVINAKLIFEEKDEELLKSNGFTPKSIGGFVIKLNKKFGKEVTMDYEPISYKDNRNIKLRAIINRIVKLSDSIDWSTEADDTKTQFIQTLKDCSALDSPEFEQNITKIDQIVKQFKKSQPDKFSVISQAFEEIKNIASDDLQKKLEEVFNNINIEFLTLDSYLIENKAPINELNDNSKHPFLYDLLTLSGKAASDFNPLGTAKLQRIELSASKKLSSNIAKVWLTHNLNFIIDREGEELLFTVNNPQGQQIILNDLSEGERWFLKYYVRLAIAQRDNKQTLWLFDEPGRDLHSSSQVDLKKFLEDISKDSQIIYTTHQAMMVPWNRLERMLVVENSSDFGTIISRRFWTDNKLKSPLKAALSSFVGEELLSGKEHIIIEGISDYFYLQGWLRFFQKKKGLGTWCRNFESRNRVMVPVDGIDKVPLYCWFLGREMRNNINWVVIVDSAEEKDNLNEKLGTSGMGSWAKKVQNIGGLSTDKGNNSIKEIENLFESDDYITIFNNYYQKNYSECKLPTRIEITKGLNGERKITKVISVLLAKKNPEIEINGKPLGLDKTGVSQYIYELLTNTEKIPFSRKTKLNFRKVLKNVDGLFDN